MYKTIVIAVDGSEGSKRAIPIAVDLAKRDDAKIVLAHVDERIVAKGGGDIHADEEQIQVDVKEQAKELSAQGIETSVEMADVMAGGAGRVIAKIADHVSADLIVTGTRGHSPVGAAAGQRHPAPASSRQAAGSGHSLRVASAFNAGYLLTGSPLSGAADLLTDTSTPCTEVLSPMSALKPGFSTFTLAPTC